MTESKPRPTKRKGAPQETGSIAGLKNVELTRRAQRDIRRLDPQDQRQIKAALIELAAEAPNLKVESVAGRPPWWRLRVGEMRVLYRHEDRPAARGKPAGQDKPAARKWIVARVVQRQELDHAVSTLP
jgi:mRNA-degrading endonuclease RelE of RelBE toxin-antitoxin system